MRMRNLLIAGLLAVSAAGGARAAEVRVLSAAAVGSGLKAVADLYMRRSGDTVSIDFATGPEILARISKGESADVVIAPDAVLKTLAGDKRLGGRPFLLGRVGIGVAIRDGARRPAIATVDEVKASVLSADAVIYSQGTSGIYLEGMMQRLGLAQPTAARTARVSNGAGVVSRLEAGKGDEIGLSAMTELALGLGNGLAIVGPLPSALQHYTDYGAAAGPAASAKPSVGAFAALLQTDEARALLKANGVDPGPAG